MSKVYLIRHGQASLGKANYDELSDQGTLQAQLLGEHFAACDLIPDLIIQGGMQRHAQTATSLLGGISSHAKFSQPEVQTNTLWNEFDFESLVKSYMSENSHQLKLPKTHSDFFSLLKKALQAWSEDKITNALPESWLEFETRVNKALEELFIIVENNTQQQTPKTIFVVSSGGVISMALKHILGTSNETMIDFNLQSRNTGITELFVKRGKCYLSSFNHVSHLATSKHKKLITHA